MQNNTFFGISQPSSLIVLDNVSSTNDYFKDLLTNFKPQLPFTAIMARNQTHGKGQRGNTWLSKPNETLTVSYLFCPKNIPPRDQFILTIISSLAVYETLKPFVNEHLAIKWPNDIMIKNKKVGGILIENKISTNAIKHSIIGIGINTYTTEFSNEIAHKSTSLKLENFDFNLTIIELARRIQKQLLYYKIQLEQEGTENLWKMYNSKLFRKDQLAKFTIENKEIQGTIKGVDYDGRLLVSIDNTINKYDLKDITYQL